MHYTSRSLFDLTADPLETARYITTKPIQALIAIGHGAIKVGKQTIRSSVYEPTTLLAKDLVLISGLGEVSLIRSKMRWPLRLLPTSMNSQILAYPKDKRSRIARIKPFQSCVSQGVLRFSCLLTDKELSSYPVGTLKELDYQTVNTFVSNFDLIQRCDYTLNEWRLIKSLSDLRQQLTLEPFTE